ncbi:MAG: class I fructose-bisphosphate aldolase [Thermoplasmatota archaeon]
MDQQKLRETAQSLVADGRGILAADESTGTCTKRFDALGIPSTETTRRDYRATLFSTPGLEDSVAGVILYDETLRQSTQDGTTIPALLKSKGIHPGIKVDTGAKELANHPGEKITEGLDGLRERLADYAELGATFAKWRAVITITQDAPSNACLIGNAHGLARYAALCQEAGIVPIVEPEVLMDGDHDIDTCEVVTRAAWETLFDALRSADVYLPGILLKPSMVISGKDADERAGAQEVAQRTFDGLLDCVPASVPGVVFLSGGQSPEEATEHLRIMNTLGDKPWKLSFSYGRALQQPALNAWNGDNANAAAAQAALKERCDANRAAALGKSFVAA